MKSAQRIARTGQYKLFLAKWFIAGCILLLRMSPAQSQITSGKEVFERMLRVYAEANTYQDQGRVQTDFYEPGQTKPKLTTIRDFTTAYNRQTNQFRFQYDVQNKPSDTPEKMVIWNQGANVQLWWTLWDSTSHEASLGEALAIAAGVSGTASRKVPGLLLAEPIGAGWGIDSLTDVKLIGTAEQDNSPCYRLAGVFEKSKEAFLWVDQKTFLLRRVDETQSASTSKQQVKMSLTYQPTLNKPITEEALTFEPPRADKLTFSPMLRDGLCILLSVIAIGWLLYVRSRKRKQSV